MQSVILYLMQDFCVVLPALGAHRRSEGGGLWTMAEIRRVSIWLKRDVITNKQTRVDESSAVIAAALCRPRVVAVLTRSWAAGLRPPQISASAAPGRPNLILGRSWVSNTDTNTKSWRSSRFSDAILL